MDDHQRMNALQMQDVGGGICLDETNLSAAVLATRLMQLPDTPKTSKWRNLRVVWFVLMPLV